MLIDARQLPAGHVVETDVCIVGGGPAGLTVARELAGFNVRVCLLEGGGLAMDRQAQELCSGAMAGNYPISPLRSRARQYGGTANRWLIDLPNGASGVRYAPLDEIDFEQRSWVAHSGWPFDKAQLEPYYRRAQKICGIGPYAYEPEAWEDGEAQCLRLPADWVVTRMFQFGAKTVFTRDIPNELNCSNNVTTYLNANVVEIETDQLGKVAVAVKVACLDGKRFSVVGKCFVLAAGGIENARLLLLSNTSQPAGLGNQYDLVGRFFMVHPQFHRDQFIPANADIFRRAFLYDVREVNQLTVMGRLGLAKKAMEREQLPNLGVMLLPRLGGYWFEKAADVEALLNRGGISRRPFRYFNRVMFRLRRRASKACRKALRIEYFNPTLEGGGWSDLPGVEKKYAFFEMVSLVEQYPDPENRVMLDAELDRLGVRKLKLHWRWSDADHQRIFRARAAVCRSLAKAALGTSQLRDLGPQNIDSHHHMGTTRMHRDLRQGVVNADCRVHGVGNLFVAGSSLFPTGGFANPTLTIVALAARLADHIKDAVQSARLLSH